MKRFAIMLSILGCMLLAPASTAQARVYRGYYARPYPYRAYYYGPRPYVRPYYRPYAGYYYGYRPYVYPRAYYYGW